jgi:hypothetical protein
MKPKKKKQQPVSDLLEQLNNYHDLRYSVNLPEAEVYEYANDGAAQAIPEYYDPKALQDFYDRSNQTVYQRWMESDDDSLLEDAIELFDVTGAYSHDDFREAKRRWKESGRPLPSGTEALDMVGAVPAIGKVNVPYKIYKFGKAANRLFPLGKILERSGFLQDRTQER